MHLATVVSMPRFIQEINTLIKSFSLKPQIFSSNPMLFVDLINNSLRENI